MEMPVDFVGHARAQNACESSADRFTQGGRAMSRGVPGTLRQLKDACSLVYYDLSRVHVVKTGMWSLFALLSYTIV